MSGRDRSSHAVMVLSGLSVVWACFVTFGGGFTLRMGRLRLSSNSPDNPLAFAFILAMAAWLMASSGQRGRFRAFIASFGLVPSAAAPAIAAAAAAAVLAIGFAKGSTDVGGADVYGYASQAELWTRGALSYHEPLVGEFSWPFSARAFAPLGYFPTGDGQTMAPIYAPGLPMLMAAFQVVGGRPAVFYVVPLLAGLAVWSAYQMGARLAGRTVGVSAAILLASSPAFLLQTLTAMSDVPATAWWALALSLTLVDRRDAALAAGLSASAAIATRPNLAPLAVCAGAPLLYQMFRERAAHGRSMQRLACFALGVVPGCLLVAALNAHLYGSPFVSGQLLANPPFSSRNVPTNLAHYTQWLWETETPAILAACAAPWLMPTGVTIFWGCFIAGVFSAYLIFMPVDYWIWLRYLLPAFPPLFVLTAGAVAARFSRYGRDVRIFGMAAFIGALALHGVAFARGEGVFRLNSGPKRFALTGAFIAERLPDQSVFISGLHSGSIRYYANRPTVRYDAIPSDRFDQVIIDLREKALHPYLVIDDNEVTGFREMFAGHTPVAALDSSGNVVLEPTRGVRIFDLAGR